MPIDLTVAGLFKLSADLSVCPGQLMRTTVNRDTRQAVRYLLSLLLVLNTLFLHTLAFAQTRQVDPDPWRYGTDLEIYRQVDSNTWSGSLVLAAGPDSHKLMLRTDPDVEQGEVVNMDIDLFYGRPIGRHGLWKAGINHRLEPDSDWRLAGGLEYGFPFFIETDSRLYATDDHLELMIEIQREFPLARTISVVLAIETRWASRTIASQEIGKGWNYLEPSVRLLYQHNATLSLFLEYRRGKLHNDLRRSAELDGEAFREEAINTGFSLSFQGL